MTTWSILLSHERTTYYRVALPETLMPAHAVAPTVIAIGGPPADPDTQAAENAANASTRAAMVELGARAVARGAAEPLGVQDEGLELLGWERADSAHSREAVKTLRARIEQAPGRLHADDGRNAATLRALAAMVDDARRDIARFDTAREGDSGDAEYDAALDLRDTLDTLVDLVAAAPGDPNLPAPMPYGVTVRPDTLITYETSHDPVEIDGRDYVVREYQLNGDGGRDFELFDEATEECLTVDLPLEGHPDIEDIRAIVAAHTRRHRLDRPARLTWEAARSLAEVVGFNGEGTVTLLVDGQPLLGVDLRQGQVVAWPDGEHAEQVATFPRATRLRTPPDRDDAS